MVRLTLIRGFKKEATGLHLDRRLNATYGPLEEGIDKVSY